MAHEIPLLVNLHEFASLLKIDRQFWGKSHKSSYLLNTGGWGFSLANK
jgi:hypothetical protein